MEGHQIFVWVSKLGAKSTRYSDIREFKRIWLDSRWFLLQIAYAVDLVRLALTIASMVLVKHVGKRDYAENVMHNDAHHSCVELAHLYVSFFNQKGNLHQGLDRESD